MTFGDWSDADAYDLAPPDPDQVALKLARLRDRFGDDDHAIARTLIAWLRRQGAIR